MSTAMQQPLQLQLDRARRAWRGSPMPRFFAWWGGELTGLLPLRWRERFGGGLAWHLLQLDGEEWTLRRTGDAVVLARWNSHLDAASQQVAFKDALRGVDAEDLRIALCLDSANVLRPRLNLPLAARDNLSQIGAFEMDRQTPFRVEQVRYDVREVRASAPAGRFAAELVVVPRQTLDPLLSKLAASGLQVDAVDVLSGTERLGANLLPADLAPRRKHPRQRLNLALGAAAIALLLLSLLQFLHNRESALEQMRTDVEGMRADAQQVSSLRQQLQDNAGAAGFLAERKAHTISALSVLQDLSQRLPTTAWLERLSIDNSGQVGFQGQSPQAARLVDAFKGSTVITDANFQGTIQVDPATGKERFYMVAQLRKPNEAKPKTAPAAAGSAP
ncbi:PilN domain-containing protein [Dyella telluris]|uniref:PilN domain-containing protein n=1 Tax=Dyella telluris TaxID=2763498 RepID=A0A7G8PZ00_9GAMM|nr:PilN domain-containing protein [Dyella telluris]QNJ99757.1 PilN domain-containing protein [Dyella telluris]